MGHTHYEGSKIKEGTTGLDSKMKAREKATGGKEGCVEMQSSGQEEEAQC